MNRLHSEFARLFLPHPLQQPGSPPAADDLFDAQGRTRALVLELGAPAEWAPLRAVWQGVQSDLGLPAPAIAVSGAGLQLWFPAPEAVAVADGRRFLDALVARYLAGMARHRLRLFPAADGTPPGQAARHAACVPAPLPEGTGWSAFVAPDLVPLFEDTPWLDSAPGDEGQAALLERVAVMKPGWLQGVCDQPTAGAAGPDAAAPAGAAAAQPGDAEAAAGADVRQRARAFLLRVMDDETAALAVRVEAARALLHAPHTGTA